MKVEVYHRAFLDFEIKFEDQIITVPAGNNFTAITYRPEYHRTYNIEVCCNNLNIINNPITITKIIFDDFWIKENNSIAFGVNQYSPEYLEYAGLNNLDVDLSVTDNNVLFFMGKLIFSFRHPIFKFYENSLC